MKPTIDAQTLAEACITGAAQDHEDIANASKADFEAAIEWAAETWRDVDYDHDGEEDDYGNVMPYRVIRLTPRQVFDRVMAVCRMAESRGFYLLPPEELTAQCL